MLNAVMGCLGFQPGHGSGFVAWHLNLFQRDSSGARMELSHDSGKLLR